MEHPRNCAWVSSLSQGMSRVSRVNMSPVIAAIEPIGVNGLYAHGFIILASCFVGPIHIYSFVSHVNLGMNHPNVDPADS